ncbi:MAG: LysE family transporter [Burkholderiales bacterium]|nr:LysE family transporter [Burkholderiales bacterium]
MEHAGAFLQALWIGLAIAAPVGPIGLLVIQRTLDHGRVVGLATGLGAAVADACYGAVGAFGVVVVMNALQAARVPLALAGGALLLWLAWRSWSAAPAEQAAKVEAAPGLGSSFAATFALTLSNPATILSFIAIFGAMGARRAGPLAPLPMVLGVLLGSALWWLLLSAGVARLRHHLDLRARRWVGRISALLLAGFALWQWAGLWPAPG